MTVIGHLSEKSWDRFFNKLLKACDYTKETREFLHNVGVGTGTLPAAEPLTAAQTSLNDSEEISEDVARAKTKNPTQFTPE